MGVEGAQRLHRAAVLGSPIAHSLSPVLHRTAYEALGLADWRYDAFEVTEPQLVSFLEGVRQDPSWVGLSLTMPLKDAALAQADACSPIARQLGAANTLLFDRSDSGTSLLADNTDPVGIVWALGRAGINDLSTSRPCILGAGATARSALAAVAKLGATHVEVVARRVSAVAELALVGERLGLSVVAREMSAAGEALTAAVVVSTLPPGVADRFASEVPSAPGTLLDVIYAPWPTVFASAWEIRGGAVLGGLEMLVGQAGRQIELMTGSSPPLEEMLQAGLLAQVSANRQT